MYKVTTYYKTAFLDNAQNSAFEYLFVCIHDWNLCCQEDYIGEL